MVTVPPLLLTGRNTSLHFVMRRLASAVAEVTAGPHLSKWKVAARTGVTSVQLRRGRRAQPHTEPMACQELLVITPPRRRGAITTYNNFNLSHKYFWLLGMRLYANELLPDLIKELRHYTLFPPFGILHHFKLLRTKVNSRLYRLVTLLVIKGYYLEVKIVAYELER